MCHKETTGGPSPNAEQIRQEFAACLAGPLRDPVMASFGVVGPAAGDSEVAVILLQPGFVGNGPIGTKSNLARALCLGSPDNHLANLDHRR